MNKNEIEAIRKLFTKNGEISYKDLNMNKNELETVRKILTRNINKSNNPVSQIISKYCHLLLHIIFVLILVFMFICVNRSIFSKIFHYLLYNKDFFVLLTALISEFGILTISPYISMSISCMLLIILTMNPFINFPPVITFLLFLMAIINGLYGFAILVNKDIQAHHKLLSEIENKIELEKIKEDIELLKAEIDKLNNR